MNSKPLFILVSFFLGSHAISLHAGTPGAQASILIQGTASSCSGAVQSAIDTAAATVGTPSANEISTQQLVSTDMGYIKSYCSLVPTWTGVNPTLPLIDATAFQPYGAWIPPGPNDDTRCGKSADSGGSYATFLVLNFACPQP